MRKFIILLSKNIWRQIRERPFYFVLINLSLSVGLLCILFLMNFLFLSFENTGVNPKAVNREGLLFYGGCTVLVLAYGMVNVAALYRHLNNENRKRYCIYKQYGCSRVKLFFLCFFEFFCYAFLSSLIGTALFFITINWQTSMGLPFQPNACWGICLYYLANLLTIIIICLRISAWKITEKELL